MSRAHGCVQGAEIRTARAHHKLRQAGDKHFKVCIDGYNILPYLMGETDTCPRDWFFYTNDDGRIVAIRYSDWKAVFAEQRAKTLQLWAEPFIELRLPKDLQPAA